MNLNEIKTIDAPLDTPIFFIENGTRKRYNSAEFWSTYSFRDFHGKAAFFLDGTADQSTLGEMIDQLESNIGDSFEWGGDLGKHSYTFDAETGLAFITDYRSSDGELIAWYYDGKEIAFLLKNYSH